MMQKKDAKMMKKKDAKMMQKFKFIKITNCSSICQHKMLLKLKFYEYRLMENFPNDFNEF